MKVQPCSKKAIMGVSGHVGAGHVHSHSGFVQDDSAGFAAAALLVGMAYPVETTIRSVKVTGDTIEIATMGGGTGRAFARRGFTPFEAELVQRAVGLDGLFSQGLALRCMGRVYGQGVLEAPVALQTAACLSVINTFARNHPDGIQVSAEGIDSNVGACMGTVLEIDGVSTAVMAVLNATAGGLGPVEDLEGNLSFCEKGQLMDRIDLSCLPTIILESKAYVPSLSDTLEEDSFWVRYNKEFDNPAVGQALIAAVEHAGLPQLQSDTAYPRNTGEMRNNAVLLGRKIIALGQQIERAKSAAEKVRLVGELAILVSQDSGGVTYMTDAVHEIAAGGGLVPGTAAVLSMAVSRATLERCLVPDFTRTDAMHYLTVTGLAIKILSGNLEEAASFLERRNRFDRDALERLLREKQGA
jgi:hypothetical protein